MQVLYERCCGLDVHAKTVVACVRTPNPDGTRQSHVRTFGTTTSALLELAQWLTETGCAHAAVESTGVYWQPVYNILEGTGEVILVNAEQVKAVPGRKTDVKDSDWIAPLLDHGLLRASFIPPRPIRELRELTRYRKRLIQERARGGPAAQGARVGQHQTRDRRDGHSGGVGPPDDQSPHCRRAGRTRAGGIGQRRIAAEAVGVARGARRAV